MRTAVVTTLKTDSQDYCLIKMGPTQKQETAIMWLAKSMGFVDSVCCYSVSGQDLSEDDTIQIDMRSGFVPASWSMQELDDIDDLDDNSMVYREQSTYLTNHLDDNSLTHREQSTYLANHGKIGHVEQDDARFPRKGGGFGKENTSNRSVSTRSTVTTSSTTTVVTSCRIHAISGDSSIASASPTRRVPQQIDSRAPRHGSYRIERHRPTPERIYCHAYSDGQLHEASKLRHANS